MPIVEEGSSRIVSGQVKGSIFPRTERETLYAIQITGSANSRAHVEGSVYARTLKVRGAGRVDGPCIIRGDVRIEPLDGVVRLLSGITVNGNMNAIAGTQKRAPDAQKSIKNVSLFVRGDIATSHNLSLSNAIVFGSVRALNCKLQDCIVFGTVTAEDKLTINSSTITGYLASKVFFEGACTMLHALGESSRRPVFAPHEDGNEIIESDVRFYPALRGSHGLFNQTRSNPADYPEFSRLDPVADWVEVEALGNSAIGEQPNPMKKWILSLGGRVADFSSIYSAIDGLTQMLRCGFEYEHYLPSLRNSLLERTMQQLTDEEKWVLAQVCEPL
jgi:hypothetical protein